MNRVFGSVLAAFGIAALIAGIFMAPVTVHAAITVADRAPTPDQRTTGADIQIVQFFERDRRNGRRNGRRIRRNDQSPPIQLRRNREIFRDEDVIRQQRQRQRRKGDQDRAREAVRRGDVLPLDGIIQGLNRSCPGTFLNAKLINQGNRFVYRVSILRPSGRRVTMLVDAGSGAILRGQCR